jgi:hypothetical protein
VAVWVRRGQGSHHLRVLVASCRRGGGGAALGPGCWPEGRHVDRGAGNGPGVRVGGALGGRGGEYGCARGRIFFKKNSFSFRACLKEPIQLTFCPKLQLYPCNIFSNFYIALPH